MTARSVQAALSATPGEPIGVSLVGNYQHCTLSLGEPGHGIVVNGTMDQLCDAVDEAKARADELRARFGEQKHFGEGPVLAAHRGLRSDD